MSDDDAAKDFDIAVSFAGEQRQYVEAVVRGLGDSVTVFYDADYRVETWGEDLVDFFTNLYQHRAKYVVIFSSAAYRDKEWTNLERRSALATAVKQRGAYVLPVKMEDVELPGLLPTTGYLDARHEGLNGIIDAVHKKVGKERVGKPVTYNGRVPKTAEDMELLLALRPQYWEYWAYAGVLKLGLEALNAKYLDYEMGFARRTGDSYEGRGAFEFLRPSIDHAVVLLEMMNSALNAEIEERAFGRPGEPGDPDRITHIAQRFLDVYEGLMDESARILGATLPDEFRRAQRAAARFGVNAVEEIREFVGEVEQTMNGLPELLEGRTEDDQPLEIQLTCVVTANDEANREFIAGLEEGIASLDE